MRVCSTEGKAVGRFGYKDTNEYEVIVFSRDLMNEKSGALQTSSFEMYTVEFL